MNTRPRVIALLLSGGAGARLWPASRQECPKQFLKIFGALSLYQLTLKRLRSAGVDEVIVALGARHGSGTRGVLLKGKMLQQDVMESRGPAC